jgi:hypothetical protein
MGVRVLNTVSQFVVFVAPLKLEAAGAPRHSLPLVQRKKSFGARQLVNIKDAVYQKTK